MKIKATKARNKLFSSPDLTRVMRLKTESWNNYSGYLSRAYDFRNFHRLNLSDSVFAFMLMTCARQLDLATKAFRVVNALATSNLAQSFRSLAQEIYANGDHAESLISKEICKAVAIQIEQSSWALRRKRLNV